VSTLIGGVNGAFLGINDIQPHLDLYVGRLGWEVHAHGTLPAAQAERLWGAGTGDLPWTELRATGAGHGRIVLLRVPDQPTPPHPRQADTGLVAINMYTRDIDASHRDLSAAGDKFRTPPATWAVPLGENVVSVTQMFLLAPDGVDIVFVQPATARGTAAWETDPDRHYTELTSVVCHVEDFEAETRFWGPSGLGMQSWYDVAFTHPGLDEMAQLPAGSVMRLSFLAGGTTARLEITRLEDRTLGIDHRARQRTGRHLGHTGWLFAVTDLDETLRAVQALGGEVLSPAHDGPVELFSGARVAFANTPNGLPVTFFEA
jgi:predicted enzyme related to lactoylglutathione lyase